MIYKKILHFNTFNNVSNAQNPYNQCLLNLRTTYKHLTKITLKSAEISVKKNYLLNGLDENIFYDWNYFIEYDECWIPMRNNNKILNSDNVDRIIEKMNNATSFLEDCSIVFSVNNFGYVQVVFQGFSGTCNLGDNKLFDQLGLDQKNSFTKKPVSKVHDFATNTTTITFNRLPLFGRTSNYLCMYFNNVPSNGCANANGDPCTFKIPLSNFFSSSNPNDNDSFFYNEQTNYNQSIEVHDKNFILSQLNVSLYNAYNEIFSSKVFLNWSFSIEIEYIQ